MLFRALTLAAVALFSAPALAQLPAPLEAALAAEPADISPEAYVMRMGLGRDAIRFAVTVEEGEAQYRLIEPASEAALNEAQAEMWAGFNRDEDEDEAADAAPSEDDEDEEGQSASVSIGSYDPEALRTAIGGSASLLREEGGQLIYAFAPQDVPGQDGAPEDMIENLRGEAVVDAERNQLVAVRFILEGSFKPNMAARINEFLLEQRFVHEEVLGGPRMSGVTMQMSGSAMFQTFSQTMQFDVEDVRYPQADSTDG